MGLSELIAGATFLWVVAIVAGSYYLLVVRPEVAAHDVLRQRIRTGGAPARVKSASLLKDVERLSAIGPLHQLLSGDNALAAKVRRLVHQAGVNVNAGQVVLGSACIAVGAYVLVTLVWQRAPWLGLVGGLVAGSLPFVVLKWLGAKRLARFEEQFPEAVSLIGRTLRAGHAFTTGLRFASEELPEPVAGEFKLLHDQQTFGMPLPEGLKAFAQRVPIIDARFFVTAVLTQMESGGNLAEVLDNLGGVIRERFKIKRQLRVLTAHGRMTGIVLALLPPALAAYLFWKTPEHLRVLLDDPLGNQMIVVAVVLQLLGAYLIHKISNVEY